MTATTTTAVATLARPCLRNSRRALFLADDVVGALPETQLSFFLSVADVVSAAGASPSLLEFPFSQTFTTISRQKCVELTLAVFFFSVFLLSYSAFRAPRMVRLTESVPRGRYSSQPCHPWEERQHRAPRACVLNHSTEHNQLLVPSGFTVPRVGGFETRRSSPIDQVSLAPSGETSPP